MALYAIGDLHLSLGGNKPMDIFKGWEDYVPRLEENWRRLIGPDDTVVLAGDTSWAMDMAGCGADFGFIESLPGRKLLLKGNHDYWWTTRNKMDTWLQGQGFGSINFLHNNCHVAEGMALCGTRGWLFGPEDVHDAKIMAREAQRLRHSLDCAAAEAPDTERVVFLHYPPLWPNARSQQLIDIMLEYGVRRCYYGHLHGNMIKRAIQGPVGGIEYRLISADALMFEPVRVEAGA